MPVFKKSYELKNMEPQWKVMRDCYSGNVQIKKNDNIRTYLPQLIGETKESGIVSTQSGESISKYQERVRDSVFRNFTKNILDEIKNAPFKKEITFKDGFIETYKDLLQKDCDLKGTTLNDYSENALGSALVYGVHATFIDYFEDRAFFESIEAPQIIGAWAKYENGEYILSSFCFFKDIVRLNEGKKGSAYEEVIYRRVVYLEHPDTVKVYELKIQDPSDNNANWYGDLNYDFKENHDFTLIEETKLGTEKLPINFLFSDKRLGVIECIAPFYDVALMNLQYFNKDSNKNYIIKISTYPMLKVTGVKQSDLKNLDGDISPDKAWVFQDSSADVSFIEPQGNSIREMREDLKELKEDIVFKTHEWLSSGRSEVTATSEAIDENNRNIRIKNLALYVKEYINENLRNFGVYHNLNDSELSNFEIDVNTDIEYLSSANKVSSLSDAFKSGAISSEAYTSKLIDLGVLPEDYSSEEDRQKVDEDFSRFNANNENENSNQGEEDA